jgi:glycosyltransferase involved in cell wall biosynthesis
MANWTAEPSTMLRRRHEVRTPARIGFLGRLSQDKGVDVLAQAVYLLNERDPDSVELVLAGDYRFVPEKQALAVKQALTKIGGQVIELGWVDRDTLFSTIDLAVFPSVFPESFGLVAAEAMAARLPFVVSDAGALPEVAGAGHPWVAKAGDPESLAAMIGNALKVNTVSATQTAYARWGTKYSVEAGKDRMADILRRLDFLDLPWSADS